MKQPLPIHPFPARMAPDLALKHLPAKPGLTVLDPMMGSGTIPVLASLQGHNSIGFDIDPMAVNIALAWGSSLEPKEFLLAASRVVETSRLHPKTMEFDDETQKFVDFWFDKDAQLQLGSLVNAILKEKECLRPGLWAAFSRLIISKDSGASRARDVSHSRPHKVRDKAKFDPRDKYLESAEYVVKRHKQLNANTGKRGSLKLSLADARKLPLDNSSVDAVLTSPPYLQAIDYMRGHKLALVWMGYALSELRDIRSNNVGAEKGYEGSDYDNILEKVVSRELDNRSKNIVRYYIHDLSKICKELSRVTKPGGQITFVVAEATIKGERVLISKIVTLVGQAMDWSLKSTSIRTIQSGRRYLPPPKDGETALDKRMKEEVCLTFATV